VPASSHPPRIEPQAGPERRTATETPPLVPPIELVHPPGPSLAPASPARRQSGPPVPAAPEAEALSSPAPRAAVAPIAVAAAPANVAAVAASPGATAATPKSSNPPPVVIDRIEIVTPPARPPAPDPLASVAARRAGFSRHRGSR